MSGIVPEMATRTATAKIDANARCMSARTLERAARRPPGEQDNPPPVQTSPWVLWSRTGPHHPRAGLSERCPGADAAPCPPAQRLLARLVLAGPVRRPRPTDAARCHRVRSPRPCWAPGPACAPCGRGAGCSPCPPPVGGARSGFGTGLCGRAAPARPQGPRARGGRCAWRPPRGRCAAAAARTRQLCGGRAADAGAICTRRGASA